MKPIKFPQANVALLAPPGREAEVETLHAHRDGTHHISLWTLSWSERLRVLVSGRVWLWVWGKHTQPPVCIDVRDPWAKKADTHLARFRNIGWWKKWRTRRAVKKAVEDGMREALAEATKEAAGGNGNPPLPFQKCKCGRLFVGTVERCPICAA